jgi:hypothetical protein
VANKQPLGFFAVQHKNAVARLLHAARFFAPEGSPLLVPLFRFMHLAVNLRKCTPKSRKIAPVFETALNLIKNARRRQRNIPQIQ